MSLLGKALDLLRRYGEVVGVDWDEGPSVLDRATNATVTNLAASPILAAAQLAIQSMKATTGSGEPQAGEQFKKSSRLYQEAGDLLVDAKPQKDNWDGTAAEAYGSVNDAHRHLTLEVAEAEREMRSVLGRLAAQVKATRDDLQSAIDFLSDYDTSTSWMNGIPGGAAVKGAADAGVAATQLARAQGSIASLVTESVIAAQAMQEPQSRYEAAAAEKKVDEDNSFPCNEPFGDERTHGRLPTRTKADQPYSPPPPQPIPHPPATPYEVPAPR